MVEIRGSFVNNSIDAVKKRNGVQVYNTIISQLDEQARQLFKNPISDTGWYSYESLLKFIEADLKLTANGDENELAIRTGALVDHQLNAVYKLLIKLGSHESIIKRHAILHQSLFRGVSINIILDGSNKAIITYSGFEKQHRLFQQSAIGIYRRVLEISGAKDIHVQFLTRIEDNKGYCELEITWT
jgi:hypothetical protein